MKQIQELQEELNGKDGIINELKEDNGSLKNQLTEKDATIQNLQGRLLDKTEEAQENHNKFITEKHKVDLAKVKLGNFIDHHEGIDGHEQLVDVLGDLQHDVI